MWDEASHLSYSHNHIDVGTADGYGNGVRQFDSIRVVYGFTHGRLCGYCSFPALPAWHLVEVRPV